MIPFEDIKLKLKEEPKVAIEIPDKNKIWSNCPACAYKHLTAAYAQLTVLRTPTWSEIETIFGSTPVTGKENLWLVFVARAEILLAEARAGYRGNWSLAMGCLAAVEHDSSMPDSICKQLREDRLTLQRGLHVVLDNHYSITPGHRALAHIAEAAREHPGLEHELRSLRRGSIEKYLAQLANIIRELEETFVLGPEAALPLAEEKI